MTWLTYFNVESGKRYRKNTGKCNNLHWFVGKNGRFFTSRKESTSFFFYILRAATPWSRKSWESKSSSSWTHIWTYSRAEAATQIIATSERSPAQAEAKPDHESKRRFSTRQPACILHQGREERRSPIISSAPSSAQRMVTRSMRARQTQPARSLSSSKVVSWNGSIRVYSFSSTSYTKIASITNTICSTQGTWARAGGLEKTVGGRSHSFAKRRGGVWEVL